MRGQGEERDPELGTEAAGGGRTQQALAWTGRAGPVAAASHAVHARCGVSRAADRPPAPKTPHHPAPPPPRGPALIGPEGGGCHFCFFIQGQSSARHREMTRGGRCRRAGWPGFRAAPTALASLAPPGASQLLQHRVTPAQGPPQTLIVTPQDAFWAVQSGRWRSLGSRSIQGAPLQTCTGHLHMWPCTLHSCSDPPLRLSWH